MYKVVKGILNEFFRIGFPAIIVIMTALPIVSWGQEKVGTAIVDGKKVELLSDGSWRYTQPQLSTDCMAIKANLEFCGIQNGWTKVADNSVDITAQFKFDDRTYGLFIVEEVGLDDGVSLEFMRTAIIENFAGATGIEPEDVVVFDVEDQKLQGRDAAIITYGGKLSGTNVIFRNMIVVDDNMTVQAAVYTFGKTVTEHLKERHSEFIEKTHIN